MRAFLILCLLLATANAYAADRVYDVVVYGGTSGAVTAAIQAKAMGKDVVVVSPDVHLGGLTSGGLGWTDSGNKAVIGGLSAEFYHRIWLHYQKPESWTQPKPERIRDQGDGSDTTGSGLKAMWTFEPHVAEAIYDAWVEELGIRVVRDAWLDRERGVAKEGARIVSISTLDGQTFAGRMFIDATYEGDLMAAAGVDYHVGRESVDTYGEEWNGVQTGVLHHRHHFGTVDVPIDPYVVPGDPSSGLLPRINPEHPGEKGAGDDKVQAYCFRMCLTNVEANRVPFPRPDRYDADQYLLLLRILDAGWREVFNKFDPVPNGKTDTNNHGPFSTDNIGMNYDYPEASYERRREIIAEHETYQQGLMYFYANDPRVPEDVRSEMAAWGLAKDEFTDNGHWPHQIYVREARRMIGKFVMTENELLKRSPVEEPVGMGSYGIDSHNVQRYITPEGHVQNEGDIGVSTQGPYQIAYGALVPKRAQCENLLVPVAVSSSHIAFGSIRMEPVFMILGQSAATAAVHALDDGVPVQDVDYAKLRARLIADGQVLEYGVPAVELEKLGGIVVDDDRARRVGNWQMSTSTTGFVGYGYRHDGNAGDGQSAAHFETTLPQSGRYEVRLAYTPHGNRASNVPVAVQHAEGTEDVSVDQRKTPPIDGRFLSLGTFSFAATRPAVVSVSNAGTDGYVVIDAVQWIAK